MKIFLILLLVCSMLPLNSYAEPIFGYGIDLQLSFDTNIVIDENKTVKEASELIFGTNNEWGSYASILLDGSPERIPTLEDTADFRNTMKDAQMKMPLNRMAGFSSQFARWKYSLGAMNERTAQYITKPQWQPSPAIQKVGPMEWIATTLDIDPNAEFSWTFNCMQDSPQDNADLVEFLTGDPKNDRNGGENWAEKRVDLGFKDPIKVAMWEIGNELDLEVETREKFRNVQVYIDYAKETIKLIKEVDPNSQICVMGATNPHSQKKLLNGEWFATYDTWRNWHIELFKDAYIRENCKVISYHSYYIPYRKINEIGNQFTHEEFIQTIVDDIKKVGGDVKVYLSEQSVWARDIFDSNGKKLGRDPREALNLTGVLYTSDYYARMLSNPNVLMATYHALNSADWRIIHKGEKTGKRYITAIGEVLKLFLNNLGENVYDLKMYSDTTRLTEIPELPTVTAMSTSKGMNLILVNKSENYRHNLTFTFENSLYRLKTKTTLTGKNMISEITEEQKDITVVSEALNSTTIFNSFSLPNKSVVVLELEKVSDDEMLEMENKQKETINLDETSVIALKTDSNMVIKNMSATELSANVITQNGKMLVPVEVFTKAMGLYLQSGETGKTTTIFGGNNTLIFENTEGIIIKNGESMKLDSLPFIKNGVQYVGLRDFFEIMDYQVIWYDEIVYVLDKGIVLNQDRLEEFSKNFDKLFK